MVQPQRTGSTRKLILIQLNVAVDESVKSLLLMQLRVMLQKTCECLKYEIKLLTNYIYFAILMKKETVTLLYSEL